jgi:hypothetical protein
MDIVWQLEAPPKLIIVFYGCDDGICLHCLEKSVIHAERSFQLKDATRQGRGPLK